MTTIAWAIAYAATVMIVHFGPPLYGAAKRGAVVIAIGCMLLLIVTTVLELS